MNYAKTKSVLNSKGIRNYKSLPSDVEPLLVIGELHIQIHFSNRMHRMMMQTQ
jgi:hypothetical protein